MSGKINRKATVIIVAVIAVIAIVGGSFAWFVTNSSLSQRFSFSGFEVSANVYFDNNGEKINANNFADDDGLYTLSLDKSDTNYIGNLRVAVNKDGGKACIRVKMVYEYSLPDGKIEQFTTDLPYEFNGNWYDNRDTDYCIYYRGSKSDGKADFSTEELIKGFDDAEFNMAGLEKNTSVRVMVEVDAVQVNRYMQLWDVEKLPWK